MKQKSNIKLRALRMLKRDAPLVNIRRALKELHGYQMDDLARITGLTRATLSAVLNGHRHARAAEEALAAIWGVPREEVFDEQGRGN